MAKQGRFDLEQTVLRLGALVLLRKTATTDDFLPFGESSVQAVSALLADAPPPRRAHDRELCQVVHLAEKLAQMDEAYENGDTPRFITAFPILLIHSEPPSGSSKDSAIHQVFLRCLEERTAVRASPDALKALDRASEWLIAAVDDIRKKAHEAASEGGSAIDLFAARDAPDPVKQINDAANAIDESVRTLAGQQPGASGGTSFISDVTRSLQSGGGLTWFEIAVITERGTVPGVSEEERQLARNRVRERVE